MKHEDFVKSTKAQKLLMETIYPPEPIKCRRVLFVPIKRKTDGYGMSACFVETSENKWIRLEDYDCFRFSITTKKEYASLRGDFEYGGIVFFLPENSLIDFGNSIEIFS